MQLLKPKGRGYFIKSSFSLLALNCLSKFSKLSALELQFGYMRDILHVSGILLARIQVDSEDPRCLFEQLHISEIDRLLYKRFLLIAEGKICLKNAKSSPLR